MMRKKQSMLTVLLLGVFLFGFAVWSMLKPADAQSQSERRNLAQLPAFSLSSFADGKWTSAFESCTLDQFPLREQFRTLKSLVSLGVFRQKDNHGVYFADGVVAKLEYPMNEESLAHAQERFGFVYDRYLKGTNVGHSGQKLFSGITERLSGARLRRVLRLDANRSPVGELD